MVHMQLSSGVCRLLYTIQTPVVVHEQPDGETEETGWRKNFLYNKDKMDTFYISMFSRYECGLINVRIRIVYDRRTLYISRPYWFLCLVIQMRILVSIL
jgi:hypothetical protein